MECMGMPLIGERFPEIKVKTTKGMMNLPGDFSGKWFVLFSHPGDFTPVCTTEFVAFQKRYCEFADLNTELIGLSIDQVQAHLKWLQWINTNLGVVIRFPVIADDLGNVAKRLGMIHAAKGTNTVRAVFVVDAKGVIRAILYYPQEVGRNLDEILRLIHALQTTDRYGVATPANWPRNELIGDDVIIPPASTEKQAKERLQKAKQGMIQCYDWWFCHYNVREEACCQPCRNEEINPEKKCKFLPQ